MLKMEPHTRANQVLPQIAALISFDLAARIIEVVIFNKGAELGSPIVISAANDLPREVGVTCPPASVDWDNTGHGVHNLDPRRLGIVNANAAAGIRLKSLVAPCEAEEEIPHKRARINPRSHVALC